MSHLDHRASAPASVRCAVVTVSDTRTLDTDSSGHAIIELLRGAGHEVVDRRLLRDDPAAVRDAVADLIEQPDVQAVITTGGTGVALRDGTVEAVDGLLSRKLEGFGELFRMLSFAEIGAAAMLSRACAGTARDTVVFVLPGSEAAVRLAMTRLILPELGHVVREATR